MSAVSNNLGKSEVPAARRAASSGWRDPRLWIGVALVAASVLVGVRLVGGADDTVEVWAARADLAPGVEVTEADLVRTRVRLEDAGDLYLEAADGLPEETNLLRSVGAGELLPENAMGEPEQALDEVTLFLPSERVPTDLRRGDVIDVRITASDTGGKSDAKPGKALEDVVVLAAPKPSDVLGASGNRQISIGVAADLDPQPVLDALDQARVQIVRNGS